jgi:hypothetical protein
MQIKARLIRHKWAIGLALLTSIIVALPQVYFRIDHKNDGVYQGIELLPDSPWSARAREVQDGHPNFGAIYYKDGKDNPYLFQPLGSMVVAYPGKLLGLDINNTLLLSRILLSALAFLLAYSFIFLFSKHKLLALAGSVLILLADSAQSLYGIMQLLGGNSPDDFVRLSRPVNPVMIYILLFGFLTAFWQFYRKGTWKWGVLAAIFLGLNFYNYFYTWTYLYAFGAILGLFMLIQKDWIEVKKILWVYLGALLVAIPYMVNLYKATQHENYVWAGIRNGVVHMREPLFVGFVVIASLIIFAWKFPKEDRKAYIFTAAILLAPFVTQNQQLLTGKILQPLHYHWFFNKPMAVLFVLITLVYWVRETRFRNVVKPFLIVAIVGSFLIGTFTQAHSYYFNNRDGGQVAIERQKYGAVMRWLNENAVKEEVVFANNEASHMVAIYTPLNLLFHRAGMYSLEATEERLLETLTTFYRLKGVSSRTAEDIFYKMPDREYISASIYGMHYRELVGTYEAIPDEEVKAIVEFYTKTFSDDDSEWLKKILEKYEVSYVVWDKSKDPQWNLGQYSFLENRADFGDVSIYQVQ